MASSLSEEGRLLCACNLAFAPAVRGRPGDFRPFNEAAGFLEPPSLLAAGPLGIDAALVGRSAAGVVLAFRGTLPGPEIGDPLAIVADWAETFETRLRAGGGFPGRVHAGFLRAFEACWPGVKTQVEQALAAPGPRRLVVTGYSKGGVLAFLAACNVVQEGLLPGGAVSVCTFAAPRPGDAGFERAYDARVPDTRRFEWRDDPAPHLPGYRRPGSTAPPSEYRPVGELRFIDWNGDIVGDSPALQAERARRFQAMLDGGHFGQILKAHRIDCGSGYLTALCPPDLCAGCKAEVV